MNSQLKPEEKIWANRLLKNLGLLILRLLSNFFETMEKGRNKFDKSLMKFGKNFIGVDDYRTYENRSDLYRRIVI